MLWEDDCRQPTDHYIKRRASLELDKASNLFRLGLVHEHSFTVDHCLLRSFQA